MDEKISKPPWNKDQLDSIKGYQKSTSWHPFTCETHGNEGVLEPTTDFMGCPLCGYKEFWCHDFMSNWGWKKSSTKKI
jgi:hypothetical protein